MIPSACKFASSSAPYEGAIRENTPTCIGGGWSCPLWATLSRQVLSVDSDGTTVHTQFGHHNYGGSRTNWFGGFNIGGF